MKNVYKIMGWSISMTALSFISLAIFIKALGVKYDAWFDINVNIILLVSGLAVFFFIITGALTIQLLTKKAQE